MTKTQLYYIITVIKTKEMIMSLNNLMYSIFLGAYFLGLDPPVYVGEYVMKNELEKSNPKTMHVVKLLKNGNWKSPELRQIINSSL